MSQQHESVEALSSDIEQTRQQMRATIDQLQERLSPQHLMQEARDSVLGITRERSSQALHTSQAAMQGAGSAISDAITQNPVLGAALGISLQWVANLGRSGGKTMEDQTQQHLIMARERVQDAASQVSTQAQLVGAQMASQAQQVGAQAQQAGTQVAAQAQQVGGQVAAQAQQVGTQVAAQAQQAGHWLQHTLEDNALLIGAAAVVVGFAIGVALPQSTPENQLMGGTRDRLLHQAQSTAQDAVHKVQSTAQDTVHKVQSAAQDALQPPPVATTNTAPPYSPQPTMPPQ